MLVIESPMKLRILGDKSLLRSRLAKELTYVDKSLTFQINKLKKQLAVVDRNGPSWKATWLRDKVADLSKKQVQCLLFEDQKGLWTYPGLGEKLSQLLGVERPQISFLLPETKRVPWSKLPKFKNRYYQDEAVEKMLESTKYGPVAISMSTGAGKSAIIRSLVKHFGLKTVVVAPSLSIAEQLYSDLLYHFGSRYVGFYGDGKKKCEKLFTVAIDDSLVKIKPGSKDHEVLSETEVLIVDESHCCPTSTHHTLLSGVFLKTPYRFFVTATLFRNDGKDLLLEALVGNAVYEKDIKTLVGEGYLSKPTFKIVEVHPEKPEPSDPNEATRVNLYYNTAVNKAAAEIASSYVSKKKPVLIRIDEIEQFAFLYPHLKNHKIAFAHGALTKENKPLVPAEFHESDVSKLVEDFNKGLYEILIGTSCIGIGTDIQVAEAGIYLVGGMSEIELTQSIGRVTRGGSKSGVYNPWTGKQKDSADWIDFYVDTPTLGRHYAARERIYNALIGEVEDYVR